jgi:hypothetical protein
MRSQLEREAALRRTVWIALVLAVAAFGAVVVRNVTDAMTGMVYQRAELADASQPGR